jgi:hypothetical protein
VHQTAATSPTPASAGMTKQDTLKGAVDVKNKPSQPSNGAAAATSVTTATGNGAVPATSAAHASPVFSNNLDAGNEGALDGPDADQRRDSISQLADGRDGEASLAEDEDYGADADASIRPITPSSLVASSSFSSLNSHAPTSRTFKSFVTGNSRVSASTKPTTNTLSQTGAQSINTNATSSPLQGSGNVAGPDGTILGVEHKGKERVSSEADMHASGANRIATSIHDGSTSIPPSSGPEETSAAGGSDSAVIAPSGSGLPLLTNCNTAVPPKLSPLRNSFTGASEQDTPSLAALAQEARTDGDTTVLPSSASISFSALPPTTPSTSLYHIFSVPSSPLLSSSASTYSHFQAASAAADQLANYPHHTSHNPKNNPRASSPPPDNASTLTLASSTGPSQSIYTNTAASKYTYDRGGRSSGLAANEDASIRALAPSRRESDSSLNSRWSAAVLSNRDPGNSGVNQGQEGDGGSYKKKTSSLRTVATTSSYYAAQSVPSQSVEIKG